MYSRICISKRVCNAFGVRSLKKMQVQMQMHPYAFKMHLNTDICKINAFFADYLPFLNAFFADFFKICKIEGICKIADLTILMVNLPSRSPNTRRFRQNQYDRGTLLIGCSRGKGSLYDQAIEHPNILRDERVWEMENACRLHL